MRLAVLAGLWLAAVGPAADPPKPAVDRYGDPLPDGAVARLGSVRFMSGRRVDSLVVSADGKRIVSVGSNGYELWDGETGRHIPPPRTIEVNEDGAWFAPIPQADRLLAVRTNLKKLVRVVDWETGKLLFEAPAPTSTPSAAPSPRTARRSTPTAATSRPAAVSLLVCSSGTPSRRNGST